MVVDDLFKWLNPKDNLHGNSVKCCEKMSESTYLF